jgi:hypothetical protein
MDSQVCPRCGRTADAFVGGLCVDCSVEEQLAAIRQREAEIEARKGPLRRQLEEATTEVGCPMKAVTVLAVQNDPYRADTPSGHRDGEWLAMHADRLGLGDRTIHLRGLHYMFVAAGDVIKPNGDPYVNDEATWTWLQDNAADSARWLGYLEFDQIVDRRNAPPVIRLYEPTEPGWYLNVGLDCEVPMADEIEPRINVSGFVGTQPYKLVIFGEKSSLEPVVGPIAERHNADLYLPTGEISDTYLYQIARIGAEDGRRMVVFALSDCDPSGWQMPISIARKLQGFQTLHFPNLDFEVRRVALTPVQARRYDLPDSVLKEKEKRAEKWQAAMNVRQVEIDALAALNPALLRSMVTEAVKPFVDYGLDRRVSEAKKRWLEEAQAAFGEQVNREQIDRIRDEAVERLDDLREEIEALNEALRVETDDEYDLPEIVVPQAELNGSVAGSPLISSDWDWVTQSRRLIESKSYREQD